MNSEPEQEQHENGDEQFATVEEARGAIQGLQPADHVKLMIIAKFFAGLRIVGSVIEPEDLLHDAIVKTIDGTRRWNKKVSIIRHLDRVMESDSGHAAKKAQRTESLEAGDVEPKAQTPSIYSQLIAKEQLEAVLPLLEGDKKALDILRLKGDGFTASEVRSKLGMSEKEYNTVSRRIRRLRGGLSRGGE